MRCLRGIFAAEQLVQPSTSTRKGETHTYDTVAACWWSIRETKRVLVLMKSRVETQPRSAMQAQLQVQAMRSQAKLQPWVWRIIARRRSISITNTIDSGQVGMQLRGQIAHGKRL